MARPDQNGKWRRLAGRRGFVIAAAALVGLALASGTAASVSDGSGAGQARPRAPLPDFPHIAVLTLENREYRQVIGSPHAPYINRLARRYALATRYYGVSHPSLPNYLAMTSGTTHGIHRDCLACEADGANLPAQLDSAGISWKGYYERLPATGFVGVHAGPRGGSGYTRAIDPFVYYDSVVDGPARSRVVPFTQLRRDLRSGRLPRLLWISPNLCNDGHYCPLRSADRFLSHLVPRLLHSLGPGGILFLTWDEGHTRAGALGRRGGGHVAMIAAGGAARRHTRWRLATNHYSLLRTIEDAWRLPELGHAGAASTRPLTGLVRRGRVS